MICLKLSELKGRTEGESEEGKEEEGEGGGGKKREMERGRMGGREGREREREHIHCKQCHIQTSPFQITLPKLILPLLSISKSLNAS